MVATSIFINISKAQTPKTVFDKAIDYLKRYNDVDVGSLLVLDHDIECSSASTWCRTFQDVEHRGSVNSLPTVSLPNHLNCSSGTIGLEKVLSLSTKASLVVMKSFKTRYNLQKLLKNLPETLLQDNIWLMLYHNVNYTEQNVHNLIMNATLDIQANLKFNSQV